MKISQRLLPYGCGLAMVCLLMAKGSAGQSASPIPNRVTHAPDQNVRVTLKGNVHPLARAEFDRGPAPANMLIDRMLLVLARSPEQESALQKLLQDQQDRFSQRFHQWLTPEQFGRQFGPSDADLEKITGWLQLHGFHGVRVNNGRTVIEFSGNAAQVEEALGTSIHKFLVDGEERWANSADPQIPAALSPVVAGVFTLHSFYKHPQVHMAEENVITARVRPGAKPEFTSSSGQHALFPADYYKIYNFDPLQTFTGAKIAIVGRSNINLQDVSYFHFWSNDQAQSAQVIVNGPDPGDLGGGEEAEAVLDTTWGEQWLRRRGSLWLFRSQLQRPMASIFPSYTSSITTSPTS